MPLYIASSSHFSDSPLIETLKIVDVDSCSKLCSSNLFFKRSWYVLFCAFAPKFVETVGPFGTTLFVSISACLFGEIILTNIDWLSVFQVITEPIFAFNSGAVSFVTDPVLRVKSQSSTPSLVVFVSAILVWSGDQEKLVSFAFSGMPTTCSVCPFLSFKFLILTLL